MIIAWNTSPAGVADAVAFFLAHKTDAYISHGEMQWGRADLDGKWVTGLEEVLKEEFADYTSAPTPSGDRSAGLVIAKDEAGKIVSIAVVAVEESPGLTFATLEDLMVDRDQRGKGIGSQMVDWISEEMKSRGVGAIFLESGLANHAAHEFFKNEGFSVVSVTMQRKI